MKTQIVAFSFNPVEIANIEEQKAAFRRNWNSFQIIFLPVDLFQQPRELMIWSLLLSKLQSSAGAEKGIAKSLLRKGFQKIIKRVRLKCLQRITIIGGHKNGDRHFVLAHSSDYIKTVEFRELNIKEHQIGLLLADRSDCRFTIAAFAGDLKFRKSLQMFADAAPRQRLVIDNERLIFHGFPAFDANALGMSPVAGKDNFTATPPHSRLAISRVCWPL